MEKKEMRKRNAMIYGQFVLGVFSFTTMILSIDDPRLFNISLAILILAITSFNSNVLYLMLEKRK